MAPPTRATHREKAFRVIRCICLNDPNVTAHRDDGNNREGQPTVSRGQLKDLLGKRELVNGEIWPLFMPDPESPIDDKLFASSVKFDLDNLKDRMGKWLKPSPEWMAERAKRIAKSEERLAQSKRSAENRNARRAMKGLAALVAERTPETDPVPAPATPAGGAASAVAAGVAATVAASTAKTKPEAKS